MGSAHGTGALNEVLQVRPQLARERLRVDESGAHAASMSRRAHGRAEVHAELVEPVRASVAALAGPTVEQAVRAAGERTGHPEVEGGYLR
ncbi:hypothetical protein [Nocardia sp. bgisy134]|uniref:hypothetical protein n=1 Tax=Nocardia sp. bgisy134 TaxID=3413789 RepID=UPI003D7090FF